MNHKPIIYLISICWNESLFLPYFLQYYSFIDKIIIFDNFSNDNSVELMKQYSNVEIANYNTNEKIRDDIYLEIKNHLWKLYRNSCDWIIIVDIDEIVYHPMGIPNYLQSLSKDIALLQCTGYEMFHPNIVDFYTPNILQKCSTGIPQEMLSKCTILNTKLVKEINYSAGCHLANPILNGRILKETPLKLLHYKFVYPLPFLIDRYRIMSTRLSEENKRNNWGFHYTNINKLVSKYQSLASRAKYVF